MQHVLIILGCAVWPDEQPSPALLRRTRKAAQLWHQGGYDLIIPSGGVGKHPPAEAEVMRRILVDLDVPDDVIRIENRSTSTRTNARNSLALLSESTQITVVTDGYHRPRAWVTFRQEGAKARTISADDCQPPPTQPLRLKQTLREGLALPWYVLSGMFKRYTTGSSSL